MLSYYKLLLRRWMLAFAWCIAHANAFCHMSLLTNHDLLFRRYSISVGAVCSGPRLDHDRRYRLVHRQAFGRSQKQRQCAASIGVLRWLRVGILEQHPNCGAHDSHRLALGKNYSR